MRVCVCLKPKNCAIFMCRSHANEYIVNAIASCRFVNFRLFVSFLLHYFEVNSNAQGKLLRN